MAWVERDQRTGLYRVIFKYQGRKYKRGLKTRSRPEANARLGSLTETLQALERGWVQVPPDVDLADFVVTGGKVVEKTNIPKVAPLRDLLDAYFAELPAGVLEANTIEVQRIHARRLCEGLGARTDVHRINLVTLQAYVKDRAGATSHLGRPLSPVTIRKEICTLRVVWNWNRSMGRVSKPFPDGKLAFPKSQPKPPFRTWSEIELQVGRERPNQTEEKRLWDCLF